MRWEQMDSLVETQFNKIRELRASKGRDYAGDEDTLGNFKRAAENLGLTAEQVWAVYAGKHWDAIITYCRKGQVESEPIHGRIDDALTYLLLLKGLVVEAEERAAHPPRTIRISAPDPLDEGQKYEWAIPRRDDAA